MADLSKLYLFRMTHVDNIPHILQHGITHVNSANANPDFVPIGDGGLINARNNFILNNGRRLGEYIPFYFGERTPMLYVMQKGFNGLTPTPAENIIYCVTSVAQIINHGLDFIFTNGHAIDLFTTQYTPADVENIDNIIDMKAIRSNYWKDENDLDKKRRKEAEFLVMGDININAVIAFVVFNDSAKKRLIHLGASESMIHILPGYYF
jgi:hypothetical protein